MTSIAGEGPCTTTVGISSNPRICPMPRGFSSASFRLSVRKRRRAHPVALPSTFRRARAQHRAVLPAGGGAMLAQCHAHPKPAFTVYPPPHVPHGRVAVAPARLDGGGLLQQGDTGAPPWEQTVFAAACAAARGERWDSIGMLSEGMRDDPAHARTQGRQLELAGKLTGVHSALSDREREAVAHCWSPTVWRCPFLLCANAALDGVSRLAPSSAGEQLCALTAFRASSPKPDHAPRPPSCSQSSSGPSSRTRRSKTKQPLSPASSR